MSNIEENKEITMKELIESIKECTKDVEECTRTMENLLEDYR